MTLEDGQEGQSLITSLCQPQITVTTHPDTIDSAPVKVTTLKGLSTGPTAPTAPTDDNDFLVKELKVINTNIAFILANQKIIVQHQEDIAKELQIKLDHKKPASARLIKRGCYIIASFLGILMILGIAGFVLALYVYM